MELDQAIRRDTLAARPAATAVPPGTLYGVTDEGNRIDRSNGLAWEPYGATGGGGGAPAAHHLTHEPGGSDPMAVDAAPATGSLRTLGTGANQAAPGNDARFGGAPAAHHATHEPGGADALVNAAWTNQVNTFTDAQIISASNNPQLRLNDTLPPADARLFRIISQSQLVAFQALSDGVAIQTQPLILTRTGEAKIATDLYEKGRGVAMGHPIDAPFNAANFVGNAPVTWTVTAGQVAANYYTLIGKTILWTLQVGPTTVGGSAGPQLIVSLPSAGTWAKVAEALGKSHQGAWKPIIVSAADLGQAFVRLYNLDGSNFVPGTSLYLTFQITLTIT